MGSSPLQVSLREATEADLPLMLAWRNNPLIWKGFYTQSRANRHLSWDEHQSWWRSRKNWRIFIVQVAYDLYQRPVGVVSFGQLDHWAPEIGFYLDISVWGQGIGKEAVRQGLEWLKNQGFTGCQTTVLESNEASIRLMKGLGFEILGPAREGELFVLKRF